MAQKLDSVEQNDMKSIIKKSSKQKNLYLYKKMKQKERVLGFKIVLVGDPGVGKTSICMKYVQSFIFESERNEGVVRNYNATIKVDDCFINLGIWDTTCKPEYKDLRRLTYAKTDAFMIVFSVDNRKSFTNAKQKWLQEITKCCPQASIIFVGNKADLRYSLDENSSEDVELLPKDMIEQQIEELHQYKYVECSALNCEGITDAFVECAKIILMDEKKHRKRQKKAILLQKCNNCQLI